MTIFPFKAYFPNFQQIDNVELFVSTVREAYSVYRERDFFLATDQAAIYPYRIKTPHRVHTGIIACTDIHDYLVGNIKKHEHTTVAKEDNQLLLTVQRNAVVKPVLLTYSPVDVIENWIDRVILDEMPFYKISLDLEDHCFWQITDTPKIEEIQCLFKKNLSQTYIADGHHRWATMECLYRKNKCYSMVLSAYFSSKNLDILSFHRVVQINMPFDEFLAQISDVAHIEYISNVEPILTDYNKKHCFFYSHQQWGAFRWKSSILEACQDDPKAILDVSILNEYVLNNIFNIQDIRTDRRIQYFEGIRPLAQFVQLVDNINGFGFVLPPITVPQVINVVEAQEALPPKSTWFEPRMRNGLLVQVF